MNNPKNKELVFLCGARDFHAMDWYKSAKELLTDHEVLILTDLIAGEGYKKLIDHFDKVHRLLILDKLLFKRQSRIGSIWRNALKLLVFPIQIAKIKSFARQHPNAVYHAHAMYYLFLAWAAKVPFVGTPQGSDVLLKPDKNKYFRKYAIKSMQGARYVTCDSERMKEKILSLAGVDARIIQNGIDISEIQKLQKQNRGIRKMVMSIRGMTSLYRIEEILTARNSEKDIDIPLTFIYPFSDEDYFLSIKEKFSNNDKLLGRQDRLTMYQLLIQTKLVISIPKSDSSPRSVYESIFCGAAVAVTYNPYYDGLPACMKSRIIIVDLDDRDWLSKAIAEADLIIQNPFIPSEESLELFDQKRSFMKMKELLFN